jgi:hypothetical protein
MQYSVSLQLKWFRDGAAHDRRAGQAKLKDLMAGLTRAFPNVPCKRDGVAMVLLRTSDETLITRVGRWMDQRGESYQIVVVDEWTVDEIVRARWLECRYSFGDYVDENESGEPFNKFSRVLCRACGWYDESVVPTPYKVSSVALRRKEDVFAAGNGLLIVKSWVKDLLVDTARAQIEWGETALVDAVGVPVKAGERGKVGWIRPKFHIGRNTAESRDSPCEKCGIPLGCGSVPNTDAKVFSHRLIVEHFGKKEPNIASLGTWVGSRRNPEGWSPARTIVLSGGLWAYLYNCGVKGMVTPDQGLYSEKGEAPVEPERRFADLKTGKEDSVLRLKMPWQRKRSS